MPPVAAPVRRRQRSPRVFHVTAMRLRVTCVVCALLLSGCYRYVPLAGVTPAPGVEVRLHLTPEGTSRLAPTLGPQTTIVAGRVDTATVGAGRVDGVSLVVSSTAKAFGGTTPWIGERVVVPAGVIAQSERRVLDRRRSVLAGGVIALAAVAGYAILRAATGGGVDAGAGGPGPTP